MYQIGDVFKKPRLPSFRCEFTLVDARYFNLISDTTKKNYMLCHILFPISLKTTNITILNESTKNCSQTFLRWIPLGGRGWLVDWLVVDNGEPGGCRRMMKENPSTRHQFDTASPIISPCIQGSIKQIFKLKFLDTKCRGSNTRTRGSIAE